VPRACAANRNARLRARPEAGPMPRRRQRPRITERYPSPSPGPARGLMGLTGNFGLPVVGRRSGPSARWAARQLGGRAASLKRHQGLGGHGDQGSSAAAGPTDRWFHIRHRRERTSPAHRACIPRAIVLAMPVPHGAALYRGGSDAPRPFPRAVRMNEFY